MRKSSALPGVAIAGCGAISAVGEGLDALRRALRTNASGLRSSERFSGARFQSNLVGLVPSWPGGSDNPAWTLANTALREARQHARAALLQAPDARVGLVLSTTKANIEALERLSDGRLCSDLARRHLQGDLLAADLAAAHGAKGPVQCVSVACASGLIAIAQGAKMIQRGAADAVLVVGVDHLSAFVVSGFTAFKALDPLGCRPFDRDRCGLTAGEAGAAIVLTRGETAPPSGVRIHGWGSSNDANHMTGPSRDGSGLVLAMRVALRSAGADTSEIDLVHAHGTGTSYNDAMEAHALRAVFGEAYPPVCASKGMLGHTLGAAGVIETILCVLAIEENLLPGTPRLGVAAEGMPATLLREPRAAAHLKRILKVNTGFGGMNAALVLGHD
jgi:3-oxoacyl-[acyl-carrier-protein] synthase II